MYTVIDIETDGLEINSNITLVGIHEFKDKNDPGVTSIYNIADQKDLCLTHLNKLIESKAKIIGHNVKFDTKLIHYSFGINLKIYHDTMYLCYVCSSVHDMIFKRNKWFGLKHAAMRELGVKDWDIGLSKKSKTTKETIDYLKKDLEYTRKLFEYYSNIIDKRDLGVYNLMVKAANVYKDIELEGIPIDIPKLDMVLSEYNIKNYELACKLKEYADINYSSPAQLQELLFKQLKLPISKRTPKGQPSTGVEPLSKLRGQHPIVDLILEKRNAEKALTFLKDWKSRHINGRIYGNFNLHTTVTGRTSCNGPNLQQVPRNKELKSLFNSTEGWKFIQLDFSQIELRFAGTVAGVQAMIEAYKNKEDLHTNMAKIITKKEVIDKQDRTGAKAANFGYLYGMMAKSFVEYAQITYGLRLSVGEAKQIRQAFFNVNKELLPYYKKIARELVDYGIITNIFGRRYKVGHAHLTTPLERQEYTRKGINFTVQSSASDYVLMGLIEVHHKTKNNPDVKILGTVHDSILLEIKDNKYLDNNLRYIKDIMENPILLNHYYGNKLPIDITVDCEVGAWGDGKEYQVP